MTLRAATTAPATVASDSAASARTTASSSSSSSSPPSLLRLLLGPLLLGLLHGPSGVFGQDYANNPFSFGLGFAGGNGLEYTLSVALIGWGLVCLLLGVRLFKTSLFCITWIVVGGLAYYIAMLESKDAKISFIVALLVGLLVAFLVLKLFMLGLMIAGAFGAFVLWECFLALFPSAVQPGGLYTMLAIVLVGGALAAWWFQKWALLLLTPVIGTFLFAQGLSKYLDDSDSRLDLNVFRTMHNDTSCNSGQCFGLFAGFIGVAGFGLLVQWSVRATHKHACTNKRAPPVLSFSLLLCARGRPLLPCHWLRVPVC